MTFKTILLSAILFLAASAGFASDKVYLKDGKTYEGKLIGRSETRLLFSVNADGVTFPMSFFPDQVEKIELDKDSMDKQIPYLKEVETVKVQVKEEQTPKTYELSLFKGSDAGTFEMATFPDSELKKVFDENEAEYYERFNSILKRYMDKFAAIQDIYVNLTTATKEDFASAKTYMDELYFELNNVFVPEAFRKSHISYLESVKANFLAFNALEQGHLDEAAKQMKISEETKQRSLSEFRQVLVSKISALPAGRPAPPSGGPAAPGAPQEAIPAHETRNTQ